MATAFLYIASYLYDDVTCNESIDMIIHVQIAMSCTGHSYCTQFILSALENCVKLEIEVEFQIFFETKC